MGLRASAVLGVAGILLTVGACSSTPTRPVSTSALGDDAITVGSFNFAESNVLAEVYSQALEGGGFRVHRAFNLGPRELVAPALSRGLIEFVPEYAGTALQFSSLGSRVPTADVQATRDGLVRALAKAQVTALAPSPAQDSNAFVVTRRTATRLGLSKLSDLTRFAPGLILGGPPECPSRPQCLAGLELVYDMKFKQFVRLDTGGPVTRQALKDGYVDVALLFSTDPAIDRDDLVELTDDRGLQPAENIIPLVRTELVDSYGLEFVNLVDEVSELLTTDVLGDLNAEVENGKSTAAVAAAWLKSERLR